MAKKMFWMIVAVVIGAGLLFAGKISDNATDIRQAQAAIEAARAAQSAAKAAEVAGRGLATVSVIQAFVLGLIVCSVLAMIGVAIFWKAKGAWNTKDAKGREKGEWVGGPNAGWKRLDHESREQISAKGTNDPVSQLAQLMLLQQLGQMQKPTRPQQIETLGPGDDEDDSYLWS